MTVDVLDVTLPTVRDAATERVVDSKVDTFLHAMMAVQQPSRLGKIELVFCEKRTKRGGWFHTGEVSARANAVSSLSATTSRLTTASASVLAWGWGTFRRKSHGRFGRST